MPVSFFGSETLKSFSLKKFLLMMGISVGVFIVSVFLHNAIYGLFGIEEVVFFCIAVFLCPAAFLVGAVGSIVCAIRGRRKQAVG